MNVVVTFPAAIAPAGQITFEPAQNALLLERCDTHCKFALYEEKGRPYLFRSVALLAATGFPAPTTVVVNDISVGEAPIQQIWIPVIYDERRSVVELEFCDRASDDNLELSHLKQPLTVKLQFA